MSLRQRLIRDVLNPLEVWRAGDLEKLQYLQEFERTQYLPPDAIRAIQLDRLRRLLEHAYDRCPFYKESFDRASVGPRDLRTLDDLGAFPILEKRDIQGRRDEMVARDWPAADLIPNYTGGSTGAPLTFFLDHGRRRSRWAATIRHNRWAGWDIGDRTAYLWGALRDEPAMTWRRRLHRAMLEPQIFLNTAHLTEENLLGFYEEMRRFRPAVVQAYARSAALFARFLKGRRLAPPRPRSVVTTAEMLEDEDRAAIEDVFGCPVFNRYGCREVSVIASECAEHRGLHVMAEGLYLEIIRGGRPAGPREEGEILVTDLLNRAMPLIRYRIGDVGAWEDGPCPCGRGLPRLRRVAGRATDFLVGRDGRLVSGPFLTLAAVGRRPSLGQLQIHQDRIGAVRFRIKPGPRFQDPADLDFLRETARAYLGEDAQVDCELVDELPSEPSGKYLFCRSTVAPEFLVAASPALPS